LAFFVEAFAPNHHPSADIGFLEQIGSHLYSQLAWFLKLQLSLYFPLNWSARYLKSPPFLGHGQSQNSCWWHDVLKHSSFVFGRRMRKLIIHG
jgi:hypothetical protein